MEIWEVLFNNPFFSECARKKVGIPGPVKQYYQAGTILANKILERAALLPSISPTHVTNMISAFFKMLYNACYNVTETEVHLSILEAVNECAEDRIRTTEYGEEVLKHLVFKEDFTFLCTTDEPNQRMIRSIESSEQRSEHPVFNEDFTSLRTTTGKENRFSLQPGMYQKLRRQILRFLPIQGMLFEGRPLIETFKITQASSRKALFDSKEIVGPTKRPAISFTQEKTSPKKLRRCRMR